MVWREVSLASLALSWADSCSWDVSFENLRSVSASDRPPEGYMGASIHCLLLLVTHLSPPVTHVCCLSHFLPRSETNEADSAKLAGELLSAAGLSEATVKKVSSAALAQLGCYCFESTAAFTLIIVNTA